jgi:hypothetical protein
VITFLETYLQKGTTALHCITTILNIPTSFCMLLLCQSKHAISEINRRVCFWVLNIKTISGHLYVKYKEQLKSWLSSLFCIWGNKHICMRCMGSILMQFPLHQTCIIILVVSFITVWQVTKILHMLTIFCVYISGTCNIIKIITVVRNERHETTWHDCNVVPFYYRQKFSS